MRLREVRDLLLRNPPGIYEEDWENPEHDIYVDGEALSGLMNHLLIGRGHFSVVYALSQNHALKISKPILDYKRDGYPEYVQFIKQFGPSPYLPRIYYHGRWGIHHATVMERLDSASDEDAAYRFTCDCIAMLHDEIDPNANELSRVLAALQERGMLHDLDEANVMLRGDDQWVFIDPHGFTDFGRS